MWNISKGQILWESITLQLKKIEKAIKDAILAGECEKCNSFLARMNYFSKLFNLEIKQSFIHKNNMKMTRILLYNSSRMLKKNICLGNYKNNINFKDSSMYTENPKCRGCILTVDLRACTEIIQNAEDVYWQ